MNSIPVIDLFAGPGGLAEGFSSVLDEKCNRVFNIKLSVEKDENAHKTLLLRSFCRQFPVGELPKEYYAMLKERILDEREKKIKNLYNLYSKEYNEANQEAWHAELGNKDFPPELVDKRIIEALNGHEKWLLIGGPPCQAYSMAGRSRVGGIDEKDHRVYLYKEYLRIIAFHQPSVFVMENVKGLLSAKVNGEKVFDWILNDLKMPSSVFPDSKSKNYKIYSFVKKEILDDRDYLIKTEKYGIPQKRHRVILLGVREDINLIPDIIKSKKQVSLESVIGNLPKLRSVINRKFDRFEVRKNKKKRYYINLIDNNFLWEESINVFAKDILTWTGFKDCKSMNLLKCPNDGVGSEYVFAKNTLSQNHPLYNWYTDDNLDGLPNHESRSHLQEDLKRYLFAALYTSINKKFPRMKDYAEHNKALIPDHESAQTGKFADRFRVQVPDEPATTVTSHISKDGHYFIHYDPEQCRSLTVREAARIQTFPDNYLFCGSRTQQFHQVGNAVPPYLAKQLAEVVFKIFSDERII